MAMKISIHSSLSLFLPKVSSKKIFYFARRKLTRGELRFIQSRGLHRFLLPLWMVFKVGVFSLILIHFGKMF